MPLLGVRGGLSVDHLVAEGRGAAFDQLGGPAVFAALGGRLVEGVGVRVATGLPDDEPRFAALFDSLGIDRGSSTPTPTVPRLWILDSRSGRRIVDVAPPSAVELETSAPTAAPADDDLITPEGFYPRLAALLDSSPLRRPAATPSTMVGIDPHQVPLQRDGMDYLRRVACAGDVLLPSRVQLALIDGDVRAAARRIADELQVSVVARLDREGMAVIMPSQEWIVQDRDVEVRETTGAGDSSAAAILAALAVGADLVTAAMFGVSVARIALAGWGAEALIAAEPLSAPSNGVIARQEKEN